MNFRLASYNVLADTFAKPETYPYATFADRPARIITRILELKADIICLQEVSSKLFSKLHRELNPTHFICYASYRSGMMGLATLVRKTSGFTVERQRESVVCALRPEDQDTFGSHLDNICLAVTLRRPDKKSARKSFVRVFNTHAPCIPGTPRIAEVFVEKLLRLSGIKNNAIIAGDFNMLPDSLGFQKMVASLKPCTNVEQKTTESTSHRVTGECTFSGAIDFIFASESMKTITEPTVEITSLLPNDKEPSDHVPVTCTFC